MALDTYAGLKTAIANTLLRDDLTDLIPDWITMCEASVRRILKSQNDIVRAYVSDGGADERYENLPGDFYELVATPRVNGDDGGTTKIDYVTPRFMDELWASNPGSVGTPRYFTIVGPQMQFWPQPNGHQIEIAYRQGVVSLNDTPPTNVNALLLEAPDIYLYGSLIHSAPLLVDDARLPVWQGLYNGAIGEFNAAHLRKRFSGAPLSMRPRRVIGG